MGAGRQFGIEGQDGERVAGGEAIHPHELVSVEAGDGDDHGVHDAVGEGG